VVEPHEAAGEGVEDLHVAKGVGDAEHQRHQHDRDDEDEHRTGVEPGLERDGEAPQRRAPGRRGDGGD